MSDSGTVSYGDLWKRALSVAGRIREISVGRDRRIGILSDNSAGYVVAYYGVLLSGNVVVALNSQSKAPDLQAWLTHSDSVLLLADPEHPQLQEVRGRIGPIDILDLESPSDLSATDARPLPGWDRRPDDLAAILYTSGTTGRPKGVMLSHANLVGNTQAIIHYLRLTFEDSIVNVLPFYYSYGNSVLHTHLAAGAKVIIENQAAFPARVWSRIADERASGFAGVPATFAVLLNRGHPEHYDLSCLRYVTQAGGAMPTALTTKLRQSLPDSTRIFVMYGQTEATARITYLPPEYLNDKLGSVGLPVDSVRIEIRSTAGDPVPAGTEGEICISGPSVMLGYWKDPEATQEAIHDGWLCTGDLGHLDDEGFLYIDGRKSEMIKTGAHRVSPLDIEEAVAELDGVAESAVIGIDDELLGQAIKVFVVRKPQTEISRRELLAHCRNRLALYKVPKEVEFVDQLPRTSSGKIQKHLLSGAQETHTQ